METMRRPVLSFQAVFIISYVLQNYYYKLMDATLQSSLNRPVTPQLIQMIKNQFFIVMLQAKLELDWKQKKICDVLTQLVRAQGL